MLELQWEVNTRDTTRTYSATQKQKNMQYRNVVFSQVFPCPGTGRTVKPSSEVNLPLWN